MSASILLIDLLMSLGVPFDLEFIAEDTCKFGKIGKALGVQAHRAASIQMLLLSFLGRNAYGGRNYPIGKEHELLDEFVGIFRFLEETEIG